MIYVIYGASGVGKKSVCKCIVDNFGLRVIDKYTTKSAEFSQLRTDTMGNKRFVDDNFLISLPNDVFEERRNHDDYIYDRYKPDNEGIVSYLIRKDGISAALEQDENDYLLVCSDSKTLINIKKYVGNIVWDQKFRKILVIGATKNSSHWTDSDNQAIYDELKKDPQQFFGVIHNRFCPDGYGEEVISRISKQWTYITGMEPISKKIFFIKPYITYPADEMVDLLTADDISGDEIKDSIRRILNKYNLSSYTISSVIAHSTILRTYYNSYTTTREDFIYNEINRLIHEIDQNFTADIVKNKLNVQGELIVENIIKQIESAGLIIVDLSHHRHNCYYELAMARAMKKQVIVIVDKKDASSVPFDENQRNRFEYEIQYNTDVFADNGRGMQIAKKISFCAVPAGSEDFTSVIREFISRANQMYQIQWE